MAKRARSAPIIAVGAVAYRITDTQIEVLIIKKAGGYWTLPKGGVWPGEEHETALRRELFEEVGLTGTVEAHIRTLEYLTPRRTPPRMKETSYYLVRADAGTIVLSAAEQIIGGRWVSFSGARKRVRRARICDVLRDAEPLLARMVEGEDTP